MLISGDHCYCAVTTNGVSTGRFMCFTLIYSLQPDEVGDGTVYAHVVQTEKLRLRVYIWVWSW